MEKLVNDVMFRLSTKIPRENIEIVRTVLYNVLQDYDISQRVTDLAIPTEDLPKEAKIYLVSRKIDGLSDNSLCRYKESLTRFFDVVHKPVGDVQTEDIRLYFYHLQNTCKMNNLSLNNQRVNLNTFFNWLNNNEYITRNPCCPIKPFKYEKKKKSALSTMELEKLRLACKNNYDRAVIEVLYSTSCRVSELVDIRMDDVDLAKGEISIRHGKGNKFRNSYLSPKAILAIQDYLSDRDYQYEYLFEKSKKPYGQLTTRSIEQRVSEIKERAGIDVSPHKMRRTSATHLFERGMPIEEIKEFLGHENIETTLGYYVNIDKNKVKADHNKYLA